MDPSTVLFCLRLVEVTCIVLITIGVWKIARKGSSK